jgi:hypothetical protein
VLLFFECSYCGVSTDDEQDEESDDPIGSDEEDDGMDASMTAGRSAGGIAETVVSPSLSASADLSASGAPAVWVPNGIKAVYKDWQMVRHQVLLTLLPAGVGYTGSEDIELNLETVGGDPYPRITIDLPLWVAEGKCIQQLERTLKADAEKLWATMDDEDEAKRHFNDDFVIMSQAIREQLLSMRPNTRVAALKATARIKLDFPVKPITDRDWHIVGNQTGVRLLFVDLKVPGTRSYEKRKVKAVQIARTYARALG